MPFDKDLQNNLAALLVKSNRFLKKCGDFITPEDFEPTGKRSPSLWFIASVALEYWETYREPIRGNLVVALRRFLKQSRYGQRVRDESLALARQLLKQKVQGLDFSIERVLELKRDRVMDSAIEELTNLYGDGKLTNEEWLRITEQVLAVIAPANRRSVDYFKTVDKRIARRVKNGITVRAPFFLIPELDSITTGIERKQLGCILAPSSRGKSLMLLWIAYALAIQGYDVLFVTCEDPLHSVEDRADAMITSIPFASLASSYRSLKKKFHKAKRLARGRLHFVDATEEQMSVAEIEHLVEDYERKGKGVHAIIIDYDDELKPSKQHKEYRLNMDEVYRDLRRMASRLDKIVWTAAQTRGRGDEEKMLITAGDIAEAVSKWRKVTMMLGLGVGPEGWGDDSMTINVIKSRNSKAHVHCSVVGKRSRMLIYDPHLTRKALQREGV